MCYLCSSSQTFDPLRHSLPDRTLESLSASDATVSGYAAAAPLPNGSLNDLANYLTNGYWEDASESAHKFDISASSTISVNLNGLTADGKKVARWALDAWEMVAGLSFLETSGSADITFDDNAAGAYALVTSLGGTIQTAEVNISASWLATYGTTVDSYSLTTYVHEIGHALGLGHQGYYNDSANFNTGAVYANDSYQMSVMSYFAQTENPNINASYALPATAMMADILAIQNLYGVSTVTAGNTVWGANSNLGNYLGTYFQGLANDNLSADFYAGDEMALTIYDQGGIDMLNLSFSTTDDRIDMHAESVSDIGGLTGNIGIARGTVLERVIAGSGNDTVLGNGVDNRIRGHAGNDSIYGGNGADMLWGGAGSDRLYGGDDKDKVYGGRGTDYADLGDGNDRFNDSWESGLSGSDTVIGGNGRDYIRLRGGNDVATGGAGRDVFIFKSSDIDSDTITDYEIGTDSLRIDDKLWSGTLDGAGVVSTFADLIGGDVIFDFGGGNMITLSGAGTLSGLADDLSIV